MSEHRPDSGQRDAGMTLPELLVSIVVIGMIATVIAAAITVTFRAQASTEGRLNVARAEQTISTWLPADLSSATSADSAIDGSPCGGPVCDGITLGGSNALLLTWPTGGSVTKVSYIYRPAGAGESYELVRVKCSNGTCDQIRVLSDLTGPPVATFVPGVTPVPPEVINVALPLEADATNDGNPVDPFDPTQSTARRIVVTVNGGGTSDGAGGGLNRVSITAGGTNLGVLVPAKPTGPSFLKATTRCGGPITIIVDDSGSIATSGASSTVEDAVESFVSALAGTPTSVQIVKFSTKSSLVRSNVNLPPSAGTWNYYHDMTDQAIVDDLVNNKIAADLVQSGGTNWEDAVYRTFYANTMDLAPDGTPKNLGADGDPSTTLPGLVVFFTDGEPTFNRVQEDRSDTSPGDITSGGPLSYPVRPSNKWPVAIGNTFDQEGFDRTQALLRPFLEREDIRVIGVGVGGIATANVYSFTSDMIDAMPKGLFYNGGKAYRRGSSTTLQSGPSNVYSGYTYLGTNTSAEKAFGNLLSLAHPTQPPNYVKATYDSGTDTWTNFDETTNLLSTSDFAALDDALLEIAVGKCGGTLTLQTKLGNGSLASQDVTYEALIDAEIKTVTTSQISRAAAIDLKFPAGINQVQTTVTPQDLGVAGYTATGWSCALRGQPLDPGRWSIIDGDPSKGVSVTINSNEAVSCTMSVS